MPGLAVLAAAADIGHANTPPISIQAIAAGSKRGRSGMPNPP